MSDLVSILIPCHNAERWVGEAIESALAQTYRSIEVIVVVDGSTDGSTEVIKGFGDRIRQEKQPNQGGPAARNRLLVLARGDWIQFLDADDYLLPNKLELQMNYLREQADTDVLFGQVTKEDWTPDKVTRDLQIIPEPHDPWILLARWYLPQTGGPVWRKAALEYVGGWKPDQPCCQEHELYLRLLKAGKRFTYCPHNGAMYRIWSEATVCHRDKQEVRWQKLKILSETETYLRKMGKLTKARLNAISLARFEIARLTWPVNPTGAEQIIHTLLQAAPGFHPQGNQPGGHHPPALYRLLWRLFGFRAAERVAGWSRSLRRVSMPNRS